MDVGNPSNMERLRWLFPDWRRAARRSSSAQSVSDDEIRATIRRDYARARPDLVPAHRDRGAASTGGWPRGRGAERWVLVATAHPAKFNDIVEPLIGATVPVPPALAALLALPSVQTEVEPRLDELRDVLKGVRMNDASRPAGLAVGAVRARCRRGRRVYFARDMIRQRRARRAIDNVISSVAFEELRNVLLPTGTGEQIHVNYLLLTQRGLLVIDLFDVAGMIFAGEKMEQWSVFGPKRHFTFTNPLPMLYDRMAAVRHLAGDVPVEGRIVFSMRGEFPKGRPDVVLRLDALQDEFPVVGSASRAAPRRRSRRSGSRSRRSPSRTPWPQDRGHSPFAAHEQENVPCQGNFPYLPRRGRRSRAPRRRSGASPVAMCRNSFGPCAFDCGPEHAGHEELRPGEFLARACP